MLMIGVVVEVMGGTAVGRCLAAGQPGCQGKAAFGRGHCSGVLVAWVMFQAVHKDGIFPDSSCQINLGVGALLKYPVRAGIRSLSSD